MKYYYIHHEYFSSWKIYNYENKLQKTLQTS